MISKKNINKFLILGFICLIFLPTFDSFFKFSPIQELFEKRKLESKPDLPKNYQEFWKFPTSFNRYFDDNYGFRKTFIYWNGIILDKIFDQPSDSRVVFGKDGWLYFDNFKSLLDISGTLEIDDDLIQKGVRAFYQNWQNLKSKNIDYLVIIAPDKAVIYPEFLPEYVRVGNKQRIDKFIEVLKAKYPDFPLIDLRSTIIDAKKNEIVFHKTDTHWNRRGAHYAYAKIMEFLNKNTKFNFDINYRNDFEDISDKKLNGDIAQIINSDQKNIDYDLKPKFNILAKLATLNNDQYKKFHKPRFFENSSNNKLPISLIYKDSFFGNLESFAAQHFSKMYTINEFPCKIDQNVIQEFKPQIVIQQFWQARIESILKECD